MGEFYVIRGLTSEVILGVDFIHHNGLNYDAIGQTMFFDSALTWEVGSIVAAEETFLPANSSKAVKCHAFKSPGLIAAGPSTAVAAVTSTAWPVAGNEGLVDIDERGNTIIMVDNLFDRAITLPRRTFIGSVEKVAINQCEELVLDMEAAPKSQGPLGLSLIHI